MKSIKKFVVRSLKGKFLAKEYNISCEDLVDILKTPGLTRDIEKVWDIDLTILNKAILNGVYTKYQKEKLEVKGVKYDSGLTIHWMDKNEIPHTKKGALTLYIGEYGSRYYGFFHPQTYGINWALKKEELE